MDPLYPRDLFNGSMSDSLGLLIADHSPAPYGDSSRFPELKKKAIQELFEMIVKMRNSDSCVGESSENFMKLLIKAGELRRLIAIETKTPSAEKFGILRKSVLSIDAGDHMSTLLSTVNFRECNEKIKDLILLNLPFLKNEEKQYHSTLKDSRYTFKLQKKRNLIFESPVKLLTQIFGTAGMQGLFTGNEGKGINKNDDGDYNNAIEGMYAFEHLVHYEEKILPMLNGLLGKAVNEKECVNDNRYIFSGRIEVNVEGKWRPLTRHFAIFSCDDDGKIGQEHIDDFKRHGIVGLLHTHHDDIKYHEKSVAELFNKILSPSTSPDEIGPTMSRLEYRLHHLAYFKRGSAAINEIVLEALKLAVNSEYSLKGNLEAMAQPYLSKY